LARPRTVERFELVEMDSEHARAVAQLAPHRHQDGFVSPIGATLAQSIAPPLEGGQRERPWCRVILADGVAAGFVMVALPSGEPDPYLWRLLIDRLHQGRGLGAATVRSLIEQFTAEGHETLVVSWVEGVGGPRRFYERLGFVEVGPTPDGETEARRPLQQQ
jgi:GNAT superfamily N-acetyltransferase